MLICDRTLDPDAVTLINQMTVRPPRERADLISDTIKRLKGAHVWPNIDVLHVFAAHDTQAARINWKPTAFTATLTNAPTFTADGGYATNGTNSIIDSNFNPATAGGLFAQNDAYFGIFLLTNNAGIGNATAGWFDGTDGVSINPRNATNFIAIRANQAATITSSGTVSTTIGLSSSVRTASNAISVRKNGIELNTGSTVSTALNSHNLQYGAVTAAAFAAQQFGVGIIGKSLTVAQDLLLYTILRDYLLALGNAV